MNFASYEFLFVFLPFTWLAARGAARFGGLRALVAVLVIASLGFYAYESPIGLVFFGGSLLFNFAGCRWVIPRFAGERWPLVACVAVNLAVLAYFKYTNFFIDNVNELAGAGLKARDIALPLGISFVTFQQIAYAVDVARGEVSDTGFLEYLLYMSFFPQLVQGPIVRHGEIVPQLTGAVSTEGQGPPRISAEGAATGISIFVLGLFKKVVLADSFAPLVSAAFDGKGAPGFYAAWTGALGYTMQIYFDFSGYSDMAIGLGRLFGIEIPVNFNAPYKARSVSEFWRRWHITLSSFLRDYLYIPLGGNRRGRPRQYVNLLVTMLLGGLWHGAAWTFVLWGGLHGLYLCLNHGWQRVARRVGIAMPGWLSWLVTFLAVVCAWVFFRAASVGRALAMLGGMIGLNGWGLEERQLLDVELLGELYVFSVDWPLLVVAVAFFICLKLPPAWQWASAERLCGRRITAAWIALLLVVSVLMLVNVHSFVYEQF